ncbi:hypothetical protein CP965_06495 [Halarcobacter mediterraneus]|uniref:DUF4912 domain-containing protein n=1 Tax=Halarcobacter mediterraneus TaxID=2023153 RepID=A0A4Q1AVH6_9BACT|nr:DUF4912 domain-containing protein [Halarcobacter mediterraneus]RXK13446.1 hypothetical protein CP965_06495 [Halarcobacter mediterraneus]
MSSKTQDLLNKSIEVDDSFSSSSHTIDTLAQEVDEQKLKFTIPSRYNKDYLRIVLVNTSKFYIYWEFSDFTLEEYGINLQKDKLYFKVINEGNELYSFDSKFALGEYFLKEKIEDLDIQVKVGIYRNSKFIEILASNTIHTFNTKIKLPTKDSEVWINKTNGFTEIIRSTMTHFTLGMSSSKYVEELERLKEFEQYEKESLSSSSFINGGKNA